MDAGSAVLDIAVSRDGKWILSGTGDGQVTVWNSESHSKVTEFRAHDIGVSVDVSPDATKIATGSQDKTACVWSLSTGERLLGPLEHKSWVVAAKFSPDGRLITTATRGGSIRVYDSQNGTLVQFPVEVNSVSNYSLAWASNSKQLFVLSRDGYIHRLDVSTGTTLSKWPIYGRNGHTLTCIALASNETFIAVSTGYSVSFWDTTSQEQIGIVTEYTYRVASMAMSSSCDFVTSGSKGITLRALFDIIPSHYLDNVSVIKNWY